MKVEVYLNTEMFSDHEVTIEAHRQGTEYIPEQSKLDSDLAPRKVDMRMNS